MNSKEEFTIQMKTKVAEIEEIPETISSGGRRISEGDHGGNGVQSDGRREKTPTDADAGDLQTFWRRTGDIKAFYGST